MMVPTAGVTVLVFTAILSTALCDVVNYRLSEDVKPLDYGIQLIPQLHKGLHSFLGNTTIQANVTRATNKIVLHANQLKINSYTVWLRDGMKMLESKLSYQNETQKMTLNLNETLNLGDRIIMVFNYEGILSNDSLGFYSSSYQDAEGKVRWILATQFHPTHARRAFPCFDEPAFKARFRITVHRQAKYHTLGNQVLKRTTKLPGNDDLYLDEFEETPPMSTYLVAIVISDFENITNVPEKYSIWARGNAIDRGQYASTVGPKLLHYLEEFTKIKYDLINKMDMVALTELSIEAMENWGLITYRETELLYDPLESTVGKQRVLTVVAHELAHMWYGNRVTCAWWEHSWLNEGFAELLQYLAGHEVEPTWNLPGQFVVDEMHTAFAVDALPSSQPLTHPVNTPSEIIAIFNTISYSKAACIIRMIMHALGAENVRSGLHDYLRNQELGVATPDALWSAIQSYVELPVKTIMEPWTTQSGYPIVTVRITGNHTTITQKRFLLNGNSTNTQWRIFLTYTTETLANFKDTVAKEILPPITEPSTIKIYRNESDWVIFNIQQTGYYRVNYDEANWKNIIRGLKSNDFEKIHELNRAQIINDLFNVARIGEVNYRTVLNAAQYLTNETNYFPWQAAFSGLSFLSRRLAGYSVHQEFQLYVLDLIENIYKKLGFEDHEGEDHLDKMNRMSVLDWACGFDNEDCVSKSKNAFAALIEKENAVPPNQRDVVYCTTMRSGTSNDWDFLWDAFLKSNVSAEQALILSALGCSDNSTILENYLKKSIDPKSGARKQDAFDIFSAVYSNGQNGVDIVLKFLEDNLRAIADHYGLWMNTIPNILPGLAARISTQDQLMKLEKFVNNNAKEVGEAGPSAVERAKSNLDWNKKYQEIITDWLRSRR